MSAVKPLSGFRKARNLLIVKIDETSVYAAAIKLAIVCTNLWGQFRQDRGIVQLRGHQRLNFYTTQDIFTGSDTNGARRSRLAKSARDHCEMASMDAAISHFDPLPHATSIRLLKLLPGILGSSIHCDLEIISLDESHETVPEYEALSYCWGSEPETQSITINQQEQRIRSNLYKALQDLRHVCEVRTLWVDALCINSADQYELSSQIWLMHGIFARASQVVVWLSNNSLVAGSDGARPEQLEKGLPHSSNSNMFHNELSHPRITPTETHDPQLNSRLAKTVDPDALPRGARRDEQEMDVGRDEEDAHCKERSSILDLFDISLPLSSKDEGTASAVRDRKRDSSARQCNQIGVPARPDKDVERRRRILQQALGAVLASPWVQRGWTLQKLLISRVSRSFEVWIKSDEDLVALSMIRKDKHVPKFLCRSRSHNLAARAVDEKVAAPFNTIEIGTRNKIASAAQPAIPKSPSLVERRSSCRKGDNTAVHTQSGRHQDPFTWPARMATYALCTLKIVVVTLAVPEMVVVHSYAVQHSLAPPFSSICGCHWSFWTDLLARVSNHAILQDLGSRIKCCKLTLMQILKLNLSPSLAKPSARLFMYCSLSATLSLRFYAYLCRKDRFQIWFVVVSIAASFAIGCALGIDMLGSSLSIMPWVMFFGLMLSDATHRAWRICFPGRPAGDGGRRGVSFQDEKDVGDFMTQYDGESNKTLCACAGPGGVRF
ncbi:hypothetical protein LTR62_008688 [Meristemomyces frigidus]|uniref:Heterokaryon incompatibility domain-containing protein n=1 Tax=Meristemomyces frigidus TaxID=1508187 RepID=A0AAN7TAQ3_9PEZI|nr:hypothetical protein LTR62_008688 [Meristemomyces frigidus]